MDQTMNQQQETENPNGNHSAEIILTVAIIVACIVLGLFYFDILPIPFKLPNQTNKLTPTPKPTVFQYDNAKGKTTLTQYIKSVIKPKFIPKNTEGESFIDNSLVDFKENLFRVDYSVEESIILAAFHFKKNTNALNDFSISIQPQKDNQTAIDPQLANSLLSSYFTNPYVVSDCQTKDLASFCESFRIVNDGKMGYGIVVPSDKNSTPTLFVFNCFVSKESKSYSTVKSCINF